MTTPAVASPAAAIGPLWAELRRDPLHPDSWLALAQAYAAAGLAPQQAYSAGQLRRLRPQWQDRLPPTPPGGGLDELLLQPRAAASQA